MITIDPVKADKALQDKINQEALSYLASTDWYITRSTETGVVVPAGVLTKRQYARARVI